MDRRERLPEEEAQANDSVNAGVPDRAFRDGDACSVTRAMAVAPLKALINVPDGIILHILHRPFSDISAPVQMAALSLLRYVFSCPESPFSADEALSGHYVQFHYVMFLKLYLSPKALHPLQHVATSAVREQRGVRGSYTDAKSAIANSTIESLRQVCLGHVNVLLALASHKHAHIRHHFSQQNIVEFLRAELSLELHAQQHGSLEGLRGDSFRGSQPRCASEAVKKLHTTLKRRSHARDESSGVCNLMAMSPDPQCAGAALYQCGKTLMRSLRF